MNNRITAKHIGTGVWGFTCEAHDEPMGMNQLSSPKAAMEVMKGHVDRDHPGQKFRLTRSSGDSGVARTSYTGKAQP